MTNVKITGRTVGIVFIAIALLGLIVLTVNPGIRDTELPAIEWSEPRQHLTGMSAECLQFLSNVNDREDGIVEFSWLGNQTQYDACWNELIELNTAQRFTLMVNIDTRTLNSTGHASANPFPAACGSNWAESTNVANSTHTADDEQLSSNTYSWTGTAREYWPCMMAMIDMLELQEAAQSGDHMHPGWGFVILPPENSIAK